uniref:Uncharacterized protein n=1 Tax=Parascaris equorum TaxID=6256 RepID=A0A914R4J4_PAREQ
MRFITVGFGSLNDLDSDFGYFLCFPTKMHTLPAHSRRAYILVLFQHDILVTVLFYMYFR